MALRLLPVAPRQGLVWVRSAFALFFRRPLPFVSLLMAFMLASLLSMLIPIAGSVLFLAALPLLSLGFMVATRSALAGGPVHPGQLVEPLTGSAPPLRRRLLRLCALHAALGLLLVVVWSAIWGEPFRQWWTLTTSGKASDAEVAAAYMDVRMQTGVLVLTALWGLLSVPFWHAGALVLWGGQTIAQALFSSTLAIWRTKGAFTLYFLGWLGVSAVFGVLNGLIFGALGMPAAGALATLPAMLIFTTAFYVSLYPIFTDTFGPPP